MSKKKLLLLCCLFACSLLFAQSSKIKKEKSYDTYRTKIFSNTDNSYGYDILYNHKVLIHQQNIPGHAGLIGFRKKEDAKKMALLVVKKLSQGKMPPTVSHDELQQLKIFF